MNNSPWLSFDKRYSVVNRFVRIRTESGLVSESHRRRDGTDYEQALRGCRITLIELKTTGPKKIRDDLRLPATAGTRLTRLSN